MQTTFEQIIEAARHLSPEEIRKLGEWVREQQELQNAESDGGRTELEEELQKYKLATKWIDEHRREYLGQWVCLDGEELISHGEDGVEVHREAKAKGIEVPFVVQIVEEPKYYGGGIERCQ